MAAAFVSTCSCGFVSEPQATSTDAVLRYREHEKGHEPGQRTGDIAQVEVRATADESPACASRKTVGRKGRAPAPAEPAKPEEQALWCLTLSLPRGTWSFPPGTAPRPALFGAWGAGLGSHLHPGRMCDITPAGGLAPPLGHRGHPQVQVSLGAAGRRA